MRGTDGIRDLGEEAQALVEGDGADAVLGGRSTP